ncbi:chaperonin-containing T-complex subunit [Martiniozyma asiatica (nom. inval.)]|nr:chaperonin-containing T-complex subunit [Martiniozyma asiatica]
MSLRLPGNPNSSLFKQGYQMHTNTDGAINRNIQACREMSALISSSIGPCGKNKIIVNDLGKIFITNDAATMIKELNVVHPAVKVLVMHSQQQEEEMGDNTNYVLVLAGELLHLAEKLVVLGLTPTEIIQGYKLANKFVMSELENIVVDEVKNFEDKNELLKIIQPVIMSKQYGQEKTISNLVVEAIQHVIPKNNPKAFNVDSIRVVKIMGGSIHNSHVIKGMVFPREPDSSVKKIESTAKVAVFNCPVDISASETKGTVLLHNADEMMNFSKGEEEELHKVIKEIFDSGVRVVVAGQGVGDMALHFLDKYGILVLKVPSKFDLRRICRVCGATPLVRLGAPLPEEMGTIDVVEAQEIGSDRVTVFKQNKETSLTSTIVIRGATKNNLDDIERAIDDGVASIKAILKDPRLLPGSGSTESELVKRVTNYGEKTPGLLQLGIKKFAESFEFLPRLLCETSGLDPNEVLPRLYASHDENDIESLNFGIDIESESPSECLIDVREESIFDSFICKKNAINLATEAVCTVLAVDQIIVAKRAGGPAMPKQPKPGNWDQAD